MLLLKGLKCRLFSMIISNQIHFVCVRISLASYIALALGKITKPPESYVEMRISKFSGSQITHKIIRDRKSVV